MRINFLKNPVINFLLTSFGLLVLGMILVFGITGLIVAFNAYPKIFQSRITVEKKTEKFSPKETLVIDFSYPVLKKYFPVETRISPQINFDLVWENSGRRLRIIPKDFWKPETAYQLSLKNGRNIFLVPLPDFKMEFSTLDYPRVKSFFPADGTKEVVFDIEDPVVVNFNESVSDFFVKFTIDPFEELVYQNNPSKTQFRLLPKEQIKEGERYIFKIYIKYREESDENYKLIYESSFETLPPAPLSWEKEFTARLAQAKKFTRAKIKEGKYIDINLAIQILSIFENGKIIDSFLISSGKRGMETPKGQYAISNKTPRAWSKVYGLYMPFWMALVPSGKFGVHELPEWPGGFKEGASHLGVPVSHGCVRLGVGPAKTVYDWTEIGTPVVIY